MVMAVTAFTPLIAQKTAYVDIDYILSKLPEYNNAQSELDKISVTWQKEIESKIAEVDKMFKAFKEEEVLLTEEMKKKRMNEIMQKEKEIKDLQKQRFGVDGDLFKKRQEMVKPIQDKVYNAIKKLCEKEQIMIMFNKAADMNIVYSNPKYDRSDAVIEMVKAGDTK
ncbi:MAG: OmpH family outer membrane protein [Bacteroidia bacterium]|nr:OmpH family outer membrane protein [Bacteroidia bacterium]